MSTNLPIEWNDKVNNPELLAYLAQYGSTEYLTAVEINQIRDATNELFTEVTIKNKTVSLTVPSGVPSDGEEWVTYTN
jgi:hypothetical protein